MFSQAKVWAGLMMALTAHCACATVGYTNARSAVGGALVDWAALGADQTAVPPGATVSGLTVSGATAFTVFSGSTFNADFLPTDTVLALFDIAGGSPVSGSFDIVFSTSVAAAGAQVQSFFTGSFGGSISAYAAGGGLLGSFGVTGMNGANGDGSAVFAGIVSTAADIKRLTFTGFGDGAAINALSVNPTVNSVPEPGTALMILGGMAAVAGAVRSRRAA